MLPDTDKASHLGFLTVIDHPASGFHGGFLLVNAVGRPLEFHCTGAVKPNRAQEVLFGDSLKPYLFGEQIAQTLVQRVQGQPLCVFTDSIAVLAVQRFVEVPILYVPDRLESVKTLLLPNPSNIPAPSVSAGDEGASAPIHEDSTNPMELPASSLKPQASSLQLANIPGLNVDHWKLIEIARYPLWFADTHEQLVQSLLEALRECSKTIDFAEPFARIRLALHEAQKAA